MAIAHSGFQNLRKWLHNPRFWIVGVLLVVLANDVSMAFRDVSSAADKSLSPWLLPFLLCDRYLQFCVALCLISVYCDAPFLDNLQPYCLQKIGRAKWMIGQFLYILVAAILFFMFLWGAMILLCLPNIRFTASWGSCLEMLAHENPFWGIFYPELILKKTAIITTIQTLSMSCMVGALIGALLLYLNLYVRRETGVLIAAAISVFDFFLYSYGDQYPVLFWVSPISWINPLHYTGKNQWQWNIRMAILCGGIFLLLLLSIKRFNKLHIETAPEI